MWKKIDAYYWQQGNFTITTVGDGTIKHTPNVLPFALYENKNLIKHFKTFDEANTRYYEIVGARAVTANTDNQPTMVPSP